MRQLISRSRAAISQLVYKQILLALTILSGVGVGRAMASMSELSSILTGLQARFKSHNQLTISCKISICLKTEELFTSKARAI